MHPPRPSLTKTDWFIFGGISLILITFYFPAVFGGAYLLSDDYYFRQLAVQGGLHWWDNLFTQMGRPLLGLFINATFKPLESLSAYAWVRGIGVAGTVWFAVTCYLFARRQAWSALPAAALVLIITTTPAWGVFAGWTACAPYPFSALMAFSAGVLLLPSPTSGRIQSIRVAGAILLGMASVSIYQVTASFIVLPFLLSLRKETCFRNRLKGASSAAGAAMFLFAANFGFIRLVKNLFPRADLSRDGLVEDLGARLRLLGGDIAPDLVLQWTLYGPSTLMWVLLGGLVAAIALPAGAALWSSGRGKNDEDYFRRTSQRILWALLPGGVALSPLVLIGQNFFSWRMLPFAAVFIFVILALLTPERYAHRPRAIILFAILGLIIYTGGQVGFGAYVFREGLVLPNVRESARWKTYLAERFEKRPPRFTYFEPAYWNGDVFSTLPNIHEYGHSSASYAWIGENAIKCYLDELFPDAPKGQTTSTTLPDALRYYAVECPSMPIIEGWRITTPDAPPKQAHFASQRQHAVLGKLDVAYGNWNTTWMGAFNDAYWPWIHHVALGWLLIDPERTQPHQIEFQSNNGLQFQIKQDRWPHIYWIAEERWIDSCEFLEVTRP